MLKKINLLNIVFVIFFYSSYAQQPEQDSVKKVKLPADYTERLDVVFTEINGWQGKMDLFIPNSNDKKALLINIHGGGWNHGTRQEATGGFTPFFKKGFMIASISYRLTPQATAPAAIEDVRCALLYLIDHADELNIDLSKIVISGGSAGGHLALMCGLLLNDHRFDSNCQTNRKIKIAAIIDRYGITDVWDWAHGPHKTSLSAVRWLGDKSEDEAFAKTVSPINYVSPQSPPVIIVHGDADPTVPIEHSLLLYEKLKNNGIKTAFIRVPGGLHGKFTKEQAEMVNRSVMNFLKELHLFE